VDRLRNYELVLIQPLFWESVRHNVMLLVAVPFMVAWSLLIAVVLYERLKGWKLYRVRPCSCPTSWRFRSSPSS
jgi:ABC-type sugar transport system permease subunit